MSMKYQIAIPGGLAAIAILSGAILASNSIYADDVVDQINITVPISCSLSGTGMNTHNAEITNGTVNSAIGETTLKAFCNDNNGFAIYAIGYTDNEDGKNVLTSSTLGSTYDIVTGTATSGDTSNWAMKLSTVTNPAPTYPIIIAGSSADTDKEQGDPDYSTFQEVPDDYALVAKRTSNTDIGASAEGSTIKSTYQAYISKTQPAGTYTGQVKYTLVHPNDATAPHKPIYMQDLTSTTIAQLLPNVNDTATVVDKRDEQEYTIAKLADGKYWMTENLNIAGGTVLSSEDTDFDSNYILPTTNGWTTSDDRLILPLSSTSGFLADNYAYVYNSGNKENCGASGQNTPCYSYYSWDAATLGSGREITAQNADASYSICPKNWRLPVSRFINGSFDATVAAESEFYNLAIHYGMSTGSWSQSTSDFYSQAGPGTIPNFLLSGLCPPNSCVGASGSNGLYWSSTKNGTSSQHLDFAPGHIYAGTVTTGYYGFSVRCLFDN